MNLIQSLIGKTPINSFVFYSGKFIGYLIWILAGLVLSGRFDIAILNTPALTMAGVIIILAGLLLAIVSLVNLGRSTRFGLPVETTTFKQHGLYRFSRNPMYLGFNLLSIGSMAVCAHPLVMLLGFYSIYTYHLIIVAEERFLEQRFGKPYLEFKNTVRRYL